MKGILKKTLACTFAVCTLASSVTAFAAGLLLGSNSTEPGKAIIGGTWYYAKGTGKVYGERYSYLIEESTEITQPFDTNKLNGCTLTVNWRIINDVTNTQFGGYESDRAYDTNKVTGSSTVAYAAPIKEFYAECNHAAYKKDSQNHDVKILSGVTKTYNY